MKTKMVWLAFGILDHVSVLLFFFGGGDIFEKKHPFNVMSPRYILQKHSETFRTVSVRIGGVSWAKMSKPDDLCEVYFLVDLSFLK